MGILTLKRWKQQPAPGGKTIQNDQPRQGKHLSCQQADEISVEAEIASLSEKERFCFESLKARWQQRVATAPLGEDPPLFSDDMILQFAHGAPAGPFNEHSAWKTMKNYDAMYLDSLSFVALQDQLKTRTLFPIQGVQTKEGNNLFYMRPCRYNPKVTPVQDIIDNLVYVMSTMNEDRRNVSHGIAFIANMDGWTMNNFSMDYCIKFLQVLQGSVVPTKVTHFFIVNPPRWFGKVYAIMKKALSPSFQKKVKMIPERKLEKYLKPGYYSWLPGEMASGRSNTRDIVEDFTDYRRYIEAEQQVEQRKQRRANSWRKPVVQENKHTTTHHFQEDPTETLSSLGDLDM